MSPRRPLSAFAGAVVVVVAALGLQAAPSYAAASDLYVKTVTDGGSDANDCASVANACATLQRALDVAAGGPVTIHLFGGSFAGAPMSGGQVVIKGLSPDTTRITALAGTAAVIDLQSAAWTLEDLTVHASTTVGVRVSGQSSVTMNDVVLDGGTCGLYVVTGSATMTDSVVKNPDATTHPGCLMGDAEPARMNGEIALWGGGQPSSVTLIRTQVIDPADGQAAVDVKGGTFAADQSYLANRDVLPDTSHSLGVNARGGTSTLTRSAVHGFNVGVEANGGSATLSDSTLHGNYIGANAVGGTLALVRSTVAGNLGGLQSNGGTVDVAGSLLGPSSGTDPNCLGTIQDEGYNLSTDDTCGFSDTSSDNAGGIGLDTDLGGPVPTLALHGLSTAVDRIPEGTAQPCPATGTSDERGVPRPADDAGDAGAFEQPATQTSVTAPAAVKPSQSFTLSAHVVVPDVEVAGLPSLSGTVDFWVDGSAWCTGVALTPSGDASCFVGGLPAGAPRITATFTPDSPADTLHGSESKVAKLLVGTKPTIKGPKRATVRVGTKASVTLRAGGQPAAKLTVVKGKAPAGMKVTTKAGTLTIAGKAKRSATGVHTLKVKASNQLGSSATFTLTIKVRR